MFSLDQISPDYNFNVLRTPTILDTGTWTWPFGICAHEASFNTRLARGITIAAEFHRSALW